MHSTERKARRNRAGSRSRSPRPAPSESMMPAQTPAEGARAAPQETDIGAKDAPVAPPGPTELALGLHAIDVSRLKSAAANNMHADDTSGVESEAPDAPKVPELGMSSRSTSRERSAGTSDKASSPAPKKEATLEDPTSPSVPQLAERPSAAPVEPEQHVDGDVVEVVIRKLKGTRPELLRTSTYYGGIKSIYGTLAGLPVLKSIAPTVESAAESLINMTPLKPSPEEQAEQKSVAVLDKRISDALCYADEVVDSKKDDTIESIVSVKKIIHNLGPVQGAVGAVCSVGDGVGKAYGSANDTVGSVWCQVFDGVSNVITGATTMAGDATEKVTSTAGGAVNFVGTTTSDVVNSAKGTVGSTVDGVKSVVGNTTNSIGANISWATSTTKSVLSAIVSYPITLAQSILGTKGKEPAPEE